MKAYILRKSISISQLYFTVNGNQPEMNFQIFSKIVKHMDQSLSEYEIKLLFNSFDSDKNGTVSFEEFTKAF